MHRLSGCPSCAEPLEEGDRFCGVCGYAVTAAAPAVSADHPTIPLPPAPTGYGAPAPGWGSVASAAPTLVDAPQWNAAQHAPDAGPLRSHPPEGTSYGRAPGPDPSYGQPTPPQPEYPRSPPGSPHHPAPEQPPHHPVHGQPPHGQTSHGQPGHGQPPHGQAPHEQTPHGQTPHKQPPHGQPGHGQPPHEQPPHGQAPQEPPHGQPPHGQPGHGQPGHSATPPEGTRTCVACRVGHVDTDGYCEHCGHAQPRERDHMEEELGSVAAVSDRGLRHHRNEDSFAVAATALPDGSAATVAIVCDGVSSASRPDEASAAAAGAANEALLDALPRGANPQEAMHEAILAAATAVNALAPEVPGAQNAPACTLVGAVVNSGLLTIGWVGDSRAYWVPDDRAALPRRLTEDDSWAAQMVAAGLMAEAEAYADVRAHAITGWLGADAYDLEPHTATFKPDHPGVVVVCTDGLWNYAESAREMAQVLPADAATRPLHSAQVLVGHALDGGGHDNVTVAVIPFTVLAEAEREPEPAPEAEARPQV